MLTMIDSTSFKYTVNDQYLSINTKYLDKLIKSVGLHNGRFIKYLYDLDSDYCIKTVIDRLKNNQYCIYYTNNGEIAIFNENVVSQYKEIVEYLNTYETKYFYRDSKITTENYLVLTDSKGLYVSFNLLKETCNLYNAELHSDSEDSEPYLVLEPVGQFSLNDDLLAKTIKDHTGSVFIDEGIYDTYLTWSEVSTILWSKLKYPMTDSEFDEYSSAVDKRITKSSYTIKSVCKLIYYKLNEFNYISGLDFFYDKLSSLDYYYLSKFKL